MDIASEIDRTTHIPQQWHLLAPRLREILPLLPAQKKHRTARPQDVLFSQDVSWDAWHLLGRPDLISNRMDNVSCTRQEASLLRLPMEILLTIVRMLDEPRMPHITAFAFTSRLAFIVVLSTIEAKLVKAAAPWAGQEIACIGSYLTDLPRALLKDGLAYHSVGMSSAPYQTDWGADNPRRMAAFARCEYGPPRLHTWDTNCTAGEGCVWRPTPRERMMANLLAGRRLFPDADDWVLRNLDTNELIRCRPRYDLRGFVIGDEHLSMTIEDALLLKICWTSTVTSQVGEFRRGVWSGHRFDIVSSSVHRSEQTAPPSSDWRDVTSDLLLQAELTRQNIATGFDEDLVHQRRRLRRIEWQKPLMTRLSAWCSSLV